MDESVQVLLFVCVPLVALLIGVIVYFRRQGRTTATFPTHSVAISSVGHEEVFVIYRGNGRRVEFSAVIEAGQGFSRPRIYVEVPREMSGDDVGALVPHVALGLATLGYQYLIYRPGPQPIPAHERWPAKTWSKHMDVLATSATPAGGVEHK